MDDQSPALDPSVADSISPEQYRRGYEMYAASDTMSTIATATGLTENQVAWLITKGDADRGMPRWAEVLAEKRAERNRYREQVGDNIALGAVSLIDKSQQIAAAAQQLQLAILGVHMAHVAQPTIQLIQRGQLPGETDAAWAERASGLISALAMDKALLETLKVFAKLADIKTPAEAFERVYHNVMMTRTSRVTDALRGFTGKVELGAKAMLPAQVTGVEKIPGAEQAVADPLDIDPDFAGMSLDELEHYDRTGEMPDRAYGNDGPADQLPEGVDIDLDPNA